MHRGEPAWSHPGQGLVQTRPVMITDLVPAMLSKRELARPKAMTGSQDQGLHIHPGDWSTVHAQLHSQLKSEIRTEILASQSAMELNMRVGLTAIQMQISALFGKIIHPTSPSSDPGAHELARRVMLREQSSVSSSPSPVRPQWECKVMKKKRRTSSCSSSSPSERDGKQ